MAALSRLQQTWLEFVEREVEREDELEVKVHFPNVVDRVLWLLEKHCCVYQRERLSCHWRDRPLHKVVNEDLARALEKDGTTDRSGIRREEILSLLQEELDKLYNHMLRREKKLEDVDRLEPGGAITILRRFSLTDFESRRAINLHSVVHAVAAPGFQNGYTDTDIEMYYRRKNVVLTIPVLLYRYNMVTRKAVQKLNRERRNAGKMVALEFRSRKAALSALRLKLLEDWHSSQNDFVQNRRAVMERARRFVDQQAKFAEEYCLPLVNERWADEVRKRASICRRFVEESYESMQLGAAVFRKHKRDAIAQCRANFDVDIVALSTFLEQKYPEAKREELVSVLESLVVDFEAEAKAASQKLSCVEEAKLRSNATFQCLYRFRELLKTSNACIKSTLKCTGRLKRLYEVLRVCKESVIAMPEHFVGTSFLRESDFVQVHTQLSRHAAEVTSRYERIDNNLRASQDNAYQWRFDWISDCVKADRLVGKVMFAKRLLALCRRFVEVPFFVLFQQQQQAYKDGVLKLQTMSIDFFFQSEDEHMERVQNSVVDEAPALSRLVRECLVLVETHIVDKMLALSIGNGDHKTREGNNPVSVFWPPNTTASDNNVGNSDEMSKEQHLLNRVIDEKNIDRVINEVQLLVVHPLTKNSDSIIDHHWSRAFSHVNAFVEHKGMMPKALRAYIKEERFGVLRHCIDLLYYQCVSAFESNTDD